eukprot:Gb_08390 [translate_table: standard]
MGKRIEHHAKSKMIIMKVPSFSMEILKHDIPILRAQLLAFVVDNLIRRALKHDGLKEYFLQSPLFYESSSLASALGMVTACLEAAIHEVTGLPCYGPEVPLAPKQDQQEITKEYCKDIFNASTSGIHIEELKDPKLRWLIKFMIASFFLSIVFIGLLLAKCPDVDLPIADDAPEFPCIIIGSTWFLKGIMQGEDVVIVMKFKKHCCGASFIGSIGGIETKKEGKGIDDSGSADYIHPDEATGGNNCSTPK